MSGTPDRKLTTQEITILLHLLRTGGGGHAPVMLLPGARVRATQLARMGLLEVWQRQSLAKGRTEGPFYTLTYRGREVALAIYDHRAERAQLEDAA